MGCNVVTLSMLRRAVLLLLISLVWLKYSMSGRPSTVVLRITPLQVCREKVSQTP